MKKATSWQVRKLILTPAFADKQPIIAMNAVLIRTYQPSAPVPSAMFRVADGSFTVYFANCEVRTLAPLFPGTRDWQNGLGSGYRPVERF